MTARRSRFCLLLGCLLLAASLASAATPRVGGAQRARLLALAERLLAEAQRQHMVNHRMDSTIRALKLLVEDLRSNELFRPSGCETCSSAPR